MTVRRRAKRRSSRLPWYLLIHQLPPEPLYLRAKIRQRLARVGAVALKNAVYVMPRREDCLEDLQWIAEEARAGGGEAYVCESEFLEDGTEAALIAQFRAEREADYQDLVDTIRQWSGPGRPGKHRDEDFPAEVTRARKRLDEITRIDFFEAPGGRRAKKLVRSLEAPGRRRSGSGKGRGSYRGRTWVTRRGIHVDRIASAWLIRRFIDRKARFRFIDPKEPRRSGELRFDMVGGDFSHEGDRCTFETLLARTGLADRALTQVAEIVHDIDLKDEKFARSEAAGVEQLLTGLVLVNAGDDARFERGSALFDELYQSFRRKLPALPKERSK
jgi:hypothetical protein